MIALSSLGSSLCPETVPNILLNEKFLLNERENEYTLYSSYQNNYGQK